MLTGIEDRVRDRMADIHLGRVMDENLDLPFHQELSRFFGTHVEDLELRLLRHVLLAAARKVVHNQHPVPGCHEGIGDVAADESGAAGNADV
jgi:hypothetical protein